MTNRQIAAELLPHRWPSAVGALRGPRGAVPGLAATAAARRRGRVRGRDWDYLWVGKRWQVCRPIRLGSFGRRTPDWAPRLGGGRAHGGRADGAGVGAAARLPGRASAAAERALQPLRRPGGAVRAPAR